MAAIKKSLRRWLALLWLSGLSVISYVVFAASPPTITSFSPTSGVVGTTSVVIQGTNLTGTKTITFNGVKATTYKNISSTSVSATVPSAATTGYIKVTTSAGSATSTTEFVVQAPPTVGTFSPTVVPVPGSGSAVVILNGANFVPGGVTTVKLNGQLIPTVQYLSGNMLSVLVPDYVQDGTPTGTKTKSGKFAVTTPYGSATTTASLVVQYPDAKRSLKSEPIPKPPNLLAEYAKSESALVALGKALFWDMQVGSDGVQACASCHFNAGADSRSKNQLNPGSRSADATTAFINNGRGDLYFNPSSKGPNYQLTSKDFPFHKLSDVLDRKSSTVLYDTNDVASSQGVFFRQFTRNALGCDEVSSYLMDDIFHVGGSNTRRVEPRNTPSVINAVFNQRNFWDGRARAIFNGVNGRGEFDGAAHLYKSTGGGIPVLTKVQIEQSSLASQSVSPPRTDTEMMSVGRPFLKFGKRLTNCSPLAKQLVHPDDSVLGTLSRYNTPDKFGKPSTGINKSSYAQMIQEAFRDEWHVSSYKIQVDSNNNETVISSGIGPDVYTLMEYNFSLFFGLAIQAYEATLVSDQTPWDKYNNNAGSLDNNTLIGADVFFSDRARCGNCHRGAALTDASISQIVGVVKTSTGDVITNTKPLGLVRLRNHEIYGRDSTGALYLKERQPQLIDTGFNNIGVRPTLDDLGIGSKFDAGVSGSAELSTARPCAGTNCGLTPPPCFGTTTVLSVDGAMKIPGLRNVELTAPYFHNGGTATLSDVLDFYLRGSDLNPVDAWDTNRQIKYQIFTLANITGPNFTAGGDFDITFSARDSNCNPSGTINDQPITGTEKVQLLSFMQSLTDTRVLNRQAPFDHPQLFVPNGHPGNTSSVTNDGYGYATDGLIEIPMTGRTGGTPLPKFLQ